MPSGSLEDRQVEMRDRLKEQRFCPSCGTGLEMATVSITEVLRYLQKDSYLPIKQAAEYLGMSRRFLERRKFEIPHYRPGGKILFRRSDLDEWMARYRREPEKLDLKRLLHEVTERVRAKRKQQKT